MRFQTWTSPILTRPQNFLVEYLNYLAKVRREVGYMPLSSRQAIRAQSIGDSGLAFYAYIALAGELVGRDDWQSYIDNLGETYQHREPGNDVPIWEGRPDGSRQSSVESNHRDPERDRKTGHRQSFVISNFPGSKTSPNRGTGGTSRLKVVTRLIGANKVMPSR